MKHSKCYSDDREFKRFKEKVKPSPIFEKEKQKAEDIEYKVKSQKFSKPSKRGEDKVASYATSEDEFENLLEQFEDENNVDFDTFSFRAVRSYCKTRNQKRAFNKFLKAIINDN